MMGVQEKVKMQVIHVGETELHVPIGCMMPRVVVHEDGGGIECEFVEFSGRVVFKARKDVGRSGRSGGFEGDERSVDIGEESEDLGDDDDDDDGEVDGGEEDEAGDGDGVNVLRKDDGKKYVNESGEEIEDTFEEHDDNDNDVEEDDERDDEHHDDDDDDDNHVGVFTQNTDPIVAQEDRRTHDVGVFTQKQPMMTQRAPKSDNDGDVTLQEEEESSSEDDITDHGFSSPSQSQSQNMSKEKIDISQDAKPGVKRAADSQAQCLDIVVKTRRGGEGKRVRFHDDPMNINTVGKYSQGLNKAHYWDKIDVDGSATLPVPRWGCSLTLVDSNKLILIGGETAGYQVLQDSTMMMLHLGKEQGLEWYRDGITTPNIPDGGRAWHTATLVVNNDNQRIVVFGGEKMVKDDREPQSDVLVFDIDFTSWFPPEIQGPCPKARAGHAAALMPNGYEIAYFGGISKSGKWLNDLFLLNTIEWKWSRPKSANRSLRPAARSYCSLTSVGDYIVCFGGNTSQRSFNDVHLFLTDTMEWVKMDILGNIPPPRTGHVAVAAKPVSRFPTIYIYGGWDDQGKERIFFDDLYELTIESRSICRFTLKHAGGRFSESPGARTGSALTAADDDTAYLFGGWGQCGEDKYMNDLHELHMR